MEPKNCVKLQSRDQQSDVTIINRLGTKISSLLKQERKVFLIKGERFIHSEKGGGGGGLEWNHPRMIRWTEKAKQ